MLELAATLDRLVDALVFCHSHGGSLIHAVVLYHGPLAQWFCPSQEIGSLDSVKACTYEHFQHLRGGGCLELKLSFGIYPELLNNRIPKPSFFLFASFKATLHNLLLKQ